MLLFIVQFHVTSFYEQLYNVGHNMTLDEGFFEHMFEVNNEHAEMIRKLITLTELWIALKGTRATTLGPDGMSNTHFERP
jgi:hypothetical protein